MQEKPEKTSTAKKIENWNVISWQLENIFNVSFQQEKYHFEICKYTPVWLQNIAQIYT